MQGSLTRMLRRRPGRLRLAAADKSPPRRQPPWSARPQAGAVPGADGGEDAPTLLINTHLAFGDAQTVAMLDPATLADKH